MKETPRYSEELQLFKITSDVGRDVSCDVIKTCVQPEPSSIHVWNTCTGKGLVADRLHGESTKNAFCGKAATQSSVFVHDTDTNTVEIRYGPVHAAS